MKQCRLIRQKPYPLPSIEDKLSRTTVIKRGDFTDTNMNIIVWITEANKAIILVTLINRVDSKTLLNTKYGYVCPTCKTSEYVRSDKDFMPQSVEREPGYYYCVRCNKTGGNK